MATIVDPQRYCSKPQNRAICITVTDMSWGVADTEHTHFSFIRFVFKFELKEIQFIAMYALLGRRRFRRAAATASEPYIDRPNIERAQRNFSKRCLLLFILSTELCLVLSVRSVRSVHRLANCAHSTQRLAFRPTNGHSQPFSILFFSSSSSSSVSRCLHALRPPLWRAQLNRWWAE